MNDTRAKILVTGAVQGVGFRPFVFRLARELRLSGWVSNSTRGVMIEAQGWQWQVEQLVARLQSDKPPLACVQSIQVGFIDPIVSSGFEIRDSDTHGPPTALILPDAATCADCLREILDSRNRRHLYPFTNCTHCGPRFSIIEALPYDRANTSMKHFRMCPECEREYHDPHNRRFHAQPNACPHCGPQIELWDAEGRHLSARHDALRHAVDAVRTGQILALKGIGGFQLIVNARDNDAILRLRTRKRREDKPFAVMVPSLTAVRAFCRISKLEAQLLLSPAAPIVLLKKQPESSDDSEIADSVAPQNPWLGVMLPYSPLHHLLLRELNFPIVATSGNLSDEPICTDEHEALERLRGIADVFLVHNRPIVRHMDDSVVRIMGGREMLLRRARGYAPLPVPVSGADSESPAVLAVGAHLKNTVALGFSGQAFVSQHIGDLETVQAFSAFQKSAADLPRLYERQPQIIACDLHPEYLSTKFAKDMTPAQCIGFQHHYAHVLSCMADNELDAPVLGVAWDGTGFGTDGTIWGGEFLLINENSFERVAHFCPFRLPGGNAAVKEPRRSALGLLYEIFGDDLFQQRDPTPLTHFSPNELKTIRGMLAAGVNSPLTSSAGRLFDALAALLGLRQRSGFEGQAAMDLEFACAPSIEEVYSFEVRKTIPLILDWQPMIMEVLNDLRSGQPVAAIAAKCHNTLSEVVLAIAHRVGRKNIVLTGGCFQNQYLCERTIRRLREEGFVPYWHRQVPPNDGGIALGQIIAALRSRSAGPGMGFKPNGRAPKLADQLTQPVCES